MGRRIGCSETTYLKHDWQVVRNVTGRQLSGVVNGLHISVLLKEPYHQFIGTGYFVNLVDVWIPSVLLFYIYYSIPRGRSALTLYDSICFEPKVCCDSIFQLSRQ